MKKGIFNRTEKLISDMEPTTNKQRAQSMLLDLERYMIVDDKINIELKAFINDKDIEDYDSKILDNFYNRIYEMLKIHNVLNRFPMNHIETYIRRKKLESLNNESKDESMNSSGTISSAGYTST